MRTSKSKKTAVVGGSALVLSQLVGKSEALSKIGNEFQVNTYTSGSQAGPSVATFGNNHFVVAWQSYGQDGSYSGIYAQRYDANASRIGGEFQVNTYTTNWQIHPYVASFGNNHFVVAWASHFQDGSYSGIYAQRYDANATRIDGEFQVNTYTSYDQQFPSVATFGNNDFVVTWESDGQDGSNSGIYAQRYDANVTRIGSEFRVNTHTSDNQLQPSTATFGDNHFVVTWGSSGQDGWAYGIYAQLYDANATRIGDEFQVNTYTYGGQFVPSVATFENNNIVIAWESSAWESDGQDGYGSGIYAQRYVANATKIGGEIQVNSYTSGDQRLPSVATFGNNNFIVTWQSNGQDGSGRGIYAQLFDVDGNKICREFQVNTYTNNDQAVPSLATFGNDHFVVTWVSRDQDGSDYGIYAQLYSLVNNAPVLNDIAIPIIYSNNQPPILIAPNITVDDVDNLDFVNATLAISGNFIPNEDRLNYMPIYSIDGNYNNATGVLLLTGVDTLTHYQEALRSVTYDNVLSNPTSLPRNITITVNDCQDNSNPIDKSILINYAPVIMLNGGNVSFTEKQLPLVIDNGLNVTDVDDTNLSNAQMRIINFVTGEDVLGFIDQNGIIGSFDSSAGELTLTGISSVANYETALRNVTYLNTSDNPDTTARIIEFLVNDGNANSTPVTRGVNVIAVNDVPALTTSGGSIDFTEKQAPVVIDSGLTVNDVDNANLTNAQVRITNFVAGEDALGFVDQNGITGSFDSSTGVLTLTGTSSVANYQTALRSVTYQNTSDDPDITSRSIEFIVNDGTANSIPVTRDIDIIAVNDPPIVINPIPDHTITAGSFFSVAVNRTAIFQDPDDPTDSLILTASQANGDPLPSGAQYDAVNDLLQGTLPVGTYPLQLTATDAANASVSTDFIFLLLKKQVPLRPIR